MTAAPADLYHRLAAFRIDEGTPALSFEARLARENGWTPSFAGRVVAEYKRFVYLAVSAGHPVTPSDQVDQAWHLHLTYSVSYWQRLCGELLGRPLHHGPTRGGEQESARFRTQYQRTLTAYRAAFGEEPPADIWPHVGVRFGEDLQFVRVSTARNWVVPKARLRRAAAGTAALLALAFATGCAGAVATPFDLAGTDFLWFLVPLLVAAWLLGRVLRERWRAPGPQVGDGKAQLPWAEAAYLSGGAERLTTATLAHLVALDVARVSADGLALEPAPEGTVSATPSPVEATLLGALPLRRDQRSDLTNLVARVEAAFAGRRTWLLDEGYLMPPTRVLGARCLAVLPVAAVLLALGLPPLVQWMQGDRPVGYLELTLVIAGAATLIDVCAPIRPLDRQSRRAKGILKRLRSSHPRSGAGAASPELIGMAVSLWGAAALSALGSASLAALATWDSRQTEAASSGGDSGGGGCAGCGGGCGGCGCGG